ncbi:MAG: patatin-like phospholipase family protein [gamma proteobacterium symbiont of Taylorina sp.]|nr:patatin-like phospholipase family protein [gamma proteobacterium symbiont of Taylorina sp.]
MSFKILSIDGGGIRGIIPGQILVSLEKKLIKKSGNPDARLSDYFDLFAGTSTGAILAAAYIYPDKKFSAQSAVDIYIREGQKIFYADLWQRIKSLGSWNDEKYSADELERVLDEAFGGLKLSDLVKPSCFVSYDIGGNEAIACQPAPVIFTQHDALEKNKDYWLKELLRGSCAAPTYFEAAQVSTIANSEKHHLLIDGGVVANDPTLCAYSEALKFDKVDGIKDMLILSLGTGNVYESYQYDTVSNWGKIAWAKPLVNISIDGSSQLTQYHMEKITSTVELAERDKARLDNIEFESSIYCRIQPELYDADVSLDNTSAENIERLQYAGIKNAEVNDKKLDRIADLLLVQNS